MLFTNDVCFILSQYSSAFHDHWPNNHDTCVTWGLVFSQYWDVAGKEVHDSCKNIRLQNRPVCVIIRLKRSDKHKGRLEWHYIKILNNKCHVDTTSVLSLVSIGLLWLSRSSAKHGTIGTIMWKHCRRRFRRSGWSKWLPLQGSPRFYLRRSGGSARSNIFKWKLSRTIGAILKYHW